jgi:hypothetical protein
MDKDEIWLKFTEIIDSKSNTVSIIRSSDLVRISSITKGNEKSIAVGTKSSGAYCIWRGGQPLHEDFISHIIQKIDTTERSNFGKPTILDLDEIVDDYVVQAISEKHLGCSLRFSPATAAPPDVRKKKKAKGK